MKKLAARVIRLRRGARPRADFYDREMGKVLGGCRTGAIAHAIDAARGLANETD